MGIAFEKLGKHAAIDCIRELHVCWTKIYKTIGLVDILGREILTYSATLWKADQSSRPLSPEASINLFRDHCFGKPTAVIDVSKWLLKVTEHLKSLYSNPRLNAVTEVSQARLLAVAILTSDYEEEAKEAMLRQWENVTFRIFGMFGKDSRTKVGDYTRLAHNIAKKKIKPVQVSQKIKNLGKEYPIDLAIEEIQEKDCYNEWKNELRYFFYRYEEYLARQVGCQISNVMWEQIWLASADDTIEHIHPQTTNKAWYGKLSGKNNNEYIQRLGNLLVLPPNINSKAGAKSFEDKKVIYQNNYLRMMDDVLAVDDWNALEIENRQYILLEWARHEWKD